MTEVTESLIRSVLDGASTIDDLRAAARAFLEAANEATSRETAEALHALAQYFNLEESSRAGIVTLVCGALVERGCEPTPIAAPLTERLRSLLESAVSLAEACTARMAAHAGKDQDSDEAFDAIRKQMAVSMPRQNAAWEALEQFWPAAIALFSASAELRATARPLRDLAGKISARHAAAHWLRFMLSVLDNEPVLVLEPETRLGMLGRISGVVDNFQLNVLLMDAFPHPGIFSRRGVSQTAVGIARGLGPQQSDEIVTGVWNLYSWQALKSDGKLPNPKHLDNDKHWIWNEGVPEDIPLFEGRRVVLLGPPSYPRTWRAQRLFNKLPARVEPERILKKPEVSDWMNRLAAAR